MTGLAHLADALYTRILTNSPKLARGLVWCRVCGRQQAVDPREALRGGWPVCCGQTMTIDAPAERSDPS